MEMFSSAHIDSVDYFGSRASINQRSTNPYEISKTRTTMAGALHYTPTYSGGQNAQKYGCSNRGQYEQSTGPQYLSIEPSTDFETFVNQQYSALFPQKRPTVVRTNQPTSHRDSGFVGFSHRSVMDNRNQTTPPLTSINNLNADYNQCDKELYFASNVGFDPTFIQTNSCIPGSSSLTMDDIFTSYLINGTPEVKSHSDSSQNQSLPKDNVRNESRTAVDTKNSRVGENQNLNMRPNSLPLKRSHQVSVVKKQFTTYSDTENISTPSSSSIIDSSNSAPFTKNKDLLESPLALGTMLSPSPSYQGCRQSEFFSAPPPLSPQGTLKPMSHTSKDLKTQVNVRQLLNSPPPPVEHAWLVPKTVQLHSENKTGSASAFCQSALPLDSIPSPSVESPLSSHLPRLLFGQSENDKQSSRNTTKCTGFDQSTTKNLYGLSSDSESDKFGSPPPLYPSLGLSPSTLSSQTATSQSSPFMDVFKFPFSEKLPSSKHGSPVSPFKVLSAKDVSPEEKLMVQQNAPPFLKPFTTADSDSVPGITSQGRKTVFISKDKAPFPSENVENSPDTRVPVFSNLEKTSYSSSSSFSSSSSLLPRTSGIVVSTSGIESPASNILQKRSNDVNNTNRIKSVGLKSISFTKGAGRRKLKSENENKLSPYSSDCMTSLQSLPPSSCSTLSNVGSFSMVYRENSANHNAIKGNSKIKTCYSDPKKSQQSEYRSEATEKAHNSDYLPDISSEFEGGKLIDSDEIVSNTEGLPSPEIVSAKDVQDEKKDCFGSSDLSTVELVSKMTSTERRSNTDCLSCSFDHVVEGNCANRFRREIISHKDKRSVERKKKDRNHKKNSEKRASNPANSSTSEPLAYSPNMVSTATNCITTANGDPEERDSSEIYRKEGKRRKKKKRCHQMNIFSQDVKDKTAFQGRTFANKVKLKERSCDEKEGKISPLGSDEDCIIVGEVFSGHNEAFNETRHKRVIKNRLIAPKLKCESIATTNDNKEVPTKGTVSSLLEVPETDFYHVREESTAQKPQRDKGSETLPSEWHTSIKRKMTETKINGENLKEAPRADFFHIKTGSTTQDSLAGEWSEHSKRGCLASVNEKVPPTKRNRHTLNGDKAHLPHIKKGSVARNPKVDDGSNLPKSEAQTNTNLSGHVPTPHPPGIFLIKSPNEDKRSVFTLPQLILTKGTSPDGKPSPVHVTPTSPQLFLFRAPTSSMAPTSNNSDPNSPSAQSPVRPSSLVLVGSPNGTGKLFQPVFHLLPTSQGQTLQNASIPMNTKILLVPASTQNLHPSEQFRETKKNIQDTTDQSPMQKQIIVESTLNASKAVSGDCKSNNSVMTESSGGSLSLDTNSNDSYSCDKENGSINTRKSCSDSPSVTDAKIETDTCRDIVSSSNTKHQSPSFSKNNYDDLRSPVSGNLFDSLFHNSAGSPCAESELVVNASEDISKQRIVQKQVKRYELSTKDDMSHLGLTTSKYSDSTENNIPVPDSAETVDGKQSSISRSSISKPQICNYDRELLKTSNMGAGNGIIAFPKSISTKTSVKNEKNPDMYFETRANLEFKESKTIKVDSSGDKEVMDLEDSSNVYDVGKKNIVEKNVNNIDDTSDANLPSCSSVQSTVTDEPSERSTYKQRSVREERAIRYAMMQFEIMERKRLRKERRQKRLDAEAKARKLENESEKLETTDKVELSSEKEVTDQAKVKGSQLKQSFPVNHETTKKPKAFWIRKTSQLTKLKSTKKRFEAKLQAKRNAIYQETTALASEAKKRKTNDVKEKIIGWKEVAKKKINGCYTDAKVKTEGITTDASTTPTTSLRNKSYLLVPSYNGFMDFSPVIVESRTRSQATREDKERFEKPKLPVLVIEQCGQEKKEIFVEDGQDLKDISSETSLAECDPDLCHRRDLKKLSYNRTTGETPLHKAARRGYSDVVALCIADGADVDAKDNAGWTALHEACSKGHVDVVRQLLKFRANPNCCSENGVRPIHDAAEVRNLAIIRLLLGYGADPLLTTYSGIAAMDCLKSPSAKEFLKDFLVDKQLINIEHDSSQYIKGRWKFHGSSSAIGDEINTTDIFEDIPVGVDTHVTFETSREPPLPLYRLPLRENGQITGFRNYYALEDVLKRLKQPRHAFFKKHKVELRKLLWKDFCAELQYNEVNNTPPEFLAHSHTNQSFIELVYIGPYASRKLFNLKCVTD